MELNPGNKRIQIGIMDDVDPNGGPDTACQQNFENQADSGKVVEEETEIFPGIYKKEFYIDYGES